MDNNVDINKELQLKNQEMLLNKKKIDLDTSMESLLVFYSNYSTNLATEINNRICMIKNINSDSEQSKIMYNTITSFFFLLSKKLQELITKKTDKIKEKLSTIDDKEYDKELKYMSIVVINQMLEYYGETIDMLVEELTRDESDVNKDKISNYLFEIIYGKMMNMLKDKFIYSIKVINNNYEENNQVMEDINKKTLK